MNWEKLPKSLIKLELSKLCYHWRFKSNIRDRWLQSDKPHKAITMYLLAYGDKNKVAKVNWENLPKSLL